MQKAVMYGGGNIGRGFIGMLFSQSGYDVVFIDVADAVVDGLNREKHYPVRLISGENYEDVEVLHVSAVNGKDQNAVADVIAEAEVMATAVGANILKFIVPNIAEGIRRRRKNGKGPLNIIICENLMDADKILEKMLLEELNEEERAWFKENVGLVEASIGRMVPVQTEEMKAGNALRVCTERYGYLPVNGAAFKGNVPRIQNMVPFEPFDFYMKRKLYIHNMSHALCAYLGLYEGKEYIWEAVADPWIRLMAREAMEESAQALSQKYGVELRDILLHIQDLLHRFTNSALKDTCARVGGDPKRKLGQTDRLIGAAILCMEQGITPAYLSVGIAGALYAYIKEQNGEQAEETALRVLEEVSQVPREWPLTEYVLSLYGKFCAGTKAENLAAAAEQYKVGSLKEIV